jgi:hypothetical protein
MVLAGKLFKGNWGLLLVAGRAFNASVCRGQVGGSGECRLGGGASGGAGDGSCRVVQVGGKGVGQRLV